MKGNSGKEPTESATGQADILLKNGTVLNVSSGELLKVNVLTSGDRIWYVGPRSDMVGGDTIILDAENRAQVIDTIVTSGQGITLTLSGLIMQRANIYGVAVGQGRLIMINSTVISTTGGYAVWLNNNDGSLALLFLLNNEALRDQNLNHSLAENDELWLLSVVSGG